MAPFRPRHPPTQLMRVVRGCRRTRREVGFCRLALSLALRGSIFVLKIDQKSHPITVDDGHTPLSDQHMPFPWTLRIPKITI